MILGIDGSSAGSGGGMRHLTELLKAYNPDIDGFEKIVVWGTKDILDIIEEQTYIEKRNIPMLNGNLIQRQIWQLFYRDREFRNSCDILLNLFGTYFGTFKPYVTMSRNMLVFDKNERKRFGYSWLRLKMKTLYYIQKYSFNHSQGIIFISQYAKNEISKHINLSKITHRVIYHGVSESFRQTPKVQKEISSYNDENPYQLLYVSNVFPYKHTWNVVEAVSLLRKKGRKVKITLIGDYYSDKKSGRKLKSSIEKFDPKRQFVNWHKKINQNEVEAFYKNSDGFVFASTCENMPNILLEAMAAGLPIACSISQPMPEFIKDACIYFDPNSVLNTELAIENLLISKENRQKIVIKSQIYSKDFSWETCGKQTFKFLNDILNNYYPKKV